MEVVSGSVGVAVGVAVGVEASGTREEEGGTGMMRKESYGNRA
jgi:hypothetical protein